MTGTFVMGEPEEIFAILVTACGCRRVLGPCRPCREIVVPILPPVTGDADAFKYFEPPSVRLEREAASVRRRRFRWDGEREGAARIFREVVE